MTTNHSRILAILSAILVAAVLLATALISIGSALLWP